MVLLCCLPACASIPNIAGVVTAATSPTDFEVNGIHILCDAHTRYSTQGSADASSISWSAKPYIGEPLLVYGRRHHNAIYANRVVFAPPESRVRGRAIIDRMLAPQPPGSLLVRADGYPILLSPSTQIIFLEPLKALADINSNTWIEYLGNQRSDGTVVAAKAVLYLNIIDDHELKLRASYDPSAYRVSGGQDKDLTHAFHRVFSGRDFRQVPASQDSVMQARIDIIGQKLIPEYQQVLAANDPSRISFHFQLVEKEYASHRIDLPNGTILVPREAVERLQNEDQIAAYLADGIAAILEKQQLRDATEKRLLTAGEIGGAPWLMMVPAFVAANKKENLERAESAQRIRVSLALMHDAGYDLTQAPKALWLLSSKKPEPLGKIPIPEDAIYAYLLLGSTWRSPALQ